MIVDGEGRDLLDELQEVDGRVQQTWGEFTLQINILWQWAVLLDPVGDVDKSDDMNSELQEDRSDDVHVEDVWLWTLLGKLLNRLGVWLAIKYFIIRGVTNPGAREREEADRHEHSTDSNLSVTKLDTIQIKNGQGVGRNETVQGQNLVHLNSGNKGTSSLTDDVRDSNNVSEL